MRWTFSALTLFAGIGQAIAADDLTVAKRRISAILRDPVSVQFTDVHLVPKAVSFTGQLLRLVCGRFNARNGFGGYAGPQPFVYDVGAGEIYPGSDGTAEREMAATVYGNFCR